MQLDILLQNGYKPNTNKEKSEKEELKIDADGISMRDRFLEKVNMFGNIHPDYRIVVVLDSLERLSEQDLKFEWLPVNFPGNLKIIVSTSERNIVRKLHTLTRENQSKPIQHNISPMNSKAAVNMIENLRRHDEYRLSIGQNMLVTELIQGSKELNPLFLRLINYLTNKWTSFELVDPRFEKCTGIDESITYFFDLLEDQFFNITCQDMLLLFNI